MKRVFKILLICLMIVAAAFCGGLLTLMMLSQPSSLVRTDPVKGKMDEIGAYLEAYFIDPYDPEVLTAAAADGAAAAMVSATGDQWSYYISAADMDAHNEQFYNEYVGVGIMIQMAEQGIRVESLTKGGSAETAGLLPGDIITHIDGTETLSLGIEGAKKMVRGEAGTQVHFTVLRGEEVLKMDLMRQQIVSAVAEAQLLNGNIGWITIENFDHHCAEQTLACVDDMLAQGAKGLVFDVRFNGGGLKTEMLAILDALLPEGELFRSRDYTGEELIEYSDAACLEIPMAVLVNDGSFSAAEFFAAAMQEYEAAVVIGEKTIGKGNFQYNFPLSDGSAVALSVGKYYTPKGKSLTDVGVTPDLEVELADEDYADLYYGTLKIEDDTQLQAALSAISGKIS